MSAERASLVPLLKFLYQFAAGAVWVWEKILRPATKPFRFLFRRIAAFYMKVWDKWVYTKEGYFSRKRAGVVIVATIAGLFCLVPVIGFTLDVALFAATYKKETLYLTQSQEIYPDDDIHSVKASETEDLSSDTSLYFRIEPSLINHLWSLLVKGDFFYPDELAAAVAPGLSKCEVVRYGIRAKFLRRHYDMYPKLLDVRCVLIKNEVQ